MANILVLYSTTDGHTVTICERLQKTMSNEGNEVELRPLADNLGIDLTPYDKVMIGASIRYGKHQPAVFEFIEKHKAALDNVDNAFFSVNIVARKPEKNTPDTNPYMKKFLEQIDWKPKHLQVFAGRLDFPRYKWTDRQMIRFIMWMTKGPTAPDTVIEYTDWDAVTAFGKAFADS